MRTRRTMKRIDSSFEGTCMRKLRSWLGVLQGILYGLARTWGAFHHSPAVVIVAESDDGFVMHIAGVQCCADFVQRNPFPDKFDIAFVALLGNASNADQRSFGNRNGKL